MLYYLTLILTSSIALIGILVKTKDDTKQTKFYKLTKGGWILLAFVVMLFIFNLFAQFQKDKIQELQDLNASQKRISDSTLQAAQRQQLELLLQKQIQKAKLDSFYFLKQLITTDTLLYKQDLSLKDQRATVIEQRANNAYLRNELSKQVEVNNSLTYPIDTLWLNALIDIQLTDSMISKLKEKKWEITYPDKLIYGNTDGDFFFPAYKFNPILFNFIRDLEIRIFPQGGQIYYKFSFENYVDTLENHRYYDRYTWVDDKLPSFATLSYSFGSGVLELHLNKIKSSVIKTGFLSSLISFCNNDTHFYLGFNGKSAKDIIKSAKIRSSTIYENHLKHIDFTDYKNLDADGKYFNNDNTIILSSKGSCSFK